MPPDPGRYGNLPIHRRVLADGSTVTHRARRFVPPPTGAPAAREVQLPPGARLDLFAAQTLGDSLAWWRLCDANGAMTADQLEADTSRPIRIPPTGPQVAR